MPDPCSFSSSPSSSRGQPSLLAKAKATYARYARGIGSRRPRTYSTSWGSLQAEFEHEMDSFADDLSMRQPAGVNEKSVIGLLLDVKHPLGNLHVQLLTLFETRMQQLPAQADWVLEARSLLSVLQESTINVVRPTDVSDRLAVLVSVERALFRLVDTGSASPRRGTPSPPHLSDDFDDPPLQPVEAEVVVEEAQQVILVADDGIDEASEPSAGSSTPEPLADDRAASKEAHGTEGDASATGEQQVQQEPPPPPPQPQQQQTDLDDRPLSPSWFSGLGDAVARLWQAPADFGGGAPLSTTFDGLAASSSSASSYSSADSQQAAAAAQPRPKADDAAALALKAAALHPPRFYYHAFAAVAAAVFEKDRAFRLRQHECGERLSVAAGGVAAGGVAAGGVGVGGVGEVAPPSAVSAFALTTSRAQFSAQHALSQARAAAAPCLKLDFLCNAVSILASAGEEGRCGADEVLSMLVHAMLRSELRAPHAEAGFIKAFAHEGVDLSGASGYCLACFESAAEAISKLSLDELLCCGPSSGGMGGDGAAHHAGRQPASVRGAAVKAATIQAGEKAGGEACAGGDGHDCRECETGAPRMAATAADVENSSVWVPAEVNAADWVAALPPSLPLASADASTTTSSAAVACPAASLPQINRGAGHRCWAQESTLIEIESGISPKAVGSGAKGGGGDGGRGAGRRGGDAWRILEWMFNAEDGSGPPADVDHPPSAPPPPPTKRKVKPLRMG